MNFFIYTIIIFTLYQLNWLYDAAHARIIDSKHGPHKNLRHIAANTAKESKSCLKGLIYYIVATGPFVAWNDGWLPLWLHFLKNYVKFGDADAKKTAKCLGIFSNLGVS
jgi:hypothetical protein